MDVSASLQLKKIMLGASLVLLLAITAKTHARADLTPHQPFNVSQNMHHKQLAHHWNRGYVYYGPRWRSYRYYWRTVSYRCHGPRCYKRMCLYRRGIWHPIRCKTRRWWRW